MMLSVFRPCSSSVQWPWLCWKRSHCRPLCAVSSVCGPESSSEWNTRSPLLLSVRTNKINHHKVCAIIKMWRIEICQTFCTVTKENQCHCLWHFSAFKIPFLKGEGHPRPEYICALPNGSLHLHFGSRWWSRCSQTWGSMDTWGIVSGRPMTQKENVM